MDILTILISGIAGIGGGFGVAKVLEKKNVSNLIKNASGFYFKRCHSRSRKRQERQNASSQRKVH
jgi:hypothetical protein